MDCSMPGFPVLHHIPEFAQAHVHWVSDAIHPSHPLSSLCPPALNLSQHQGLFQWVGSSHQVAKVLVLQLQHQSFQWIFRVSLSQTHPSLWLLPLGHLHQRRSLLSSLGCDILERMAEWKVFGESLRICPEVNVLLKIIDTPSQAQVWSFLECQTWTWCEVPTQGSNPGLLLCRQTLYCLSHEGSLKYSSID